MTSLVLQGVAGCTPTPNPRQWTAQRPRACNTRPLLTTPLIVTETGGLLPIMVHASTDRNNHPRPTTGCVL